MPAVPDEFLDLFSRDKRAFAYLATVMSNGSPQLTPVWFDYDGKHVIVNTSTDRVKHKTMREGSRVALVVVDPGNPYRYIQVRGEIASITEADGDLVIDSLAMKYLGVERFPGRRPGETRVTHRIAIDRVQTMNYVPSD